MSEIGNDKENLKAIENDSKKEDLRINLEEEKEEREHTRYEDIQGLIMLEDKLSSVPFQFHFDSCSICNVGRPFNGLFDSNRLYPLAKTPHLWVLSKRHIPSSHTGIRTNDMMSN
ncbi:hypothetical protein HZH68_016237 [Vespula germanica]|uniref:Uncharacterized protein n=1 Tax=Vespula germanica TaxID=30212 RepID=A0A834MPC1_VESGE|nr:hypothetical protein HZH68_016237 [Vespula germanica]